MADHAEARVARDQEHVAGDPIHEHLLAGDAVVAKSKEYPGHVGVDLNAID